MSAGYIQLVALGQQDAYLTGEPQVTYFSGVYKRHTPFVLEAYDIPFNDQLVTYGGTSICRIPPKGDLIRGLTLKMILPALYNPGNDWTWSTAPTISNLPTVWVGLASGQTIGPVRAIYSPYYYTTNVLYQNWFTPFSTNPYFSVAYTTATNYFQFSNVSNVIVSGTNLGTSSSATFWGFDPLNYTSTDPTGNLIYNATSSGIVVPDYTLQQAGWTQTVGVLPNPLTGMYLTLNQPYPLSGLQFLNFSGTSPSGTYWTAYDTQSTVYNVTSGGCVQILQVGTYLVRLGFNLGVGSVQNVSYGSATTDGQPIAPAFTFTYNYTVSPDPSTPTVIPVTVTTPGLYYYFYVTTTGVQALPGTYVTVYPANDFYYLTSNIAGVVGPVSASTTLPLTSNIATPQNATMTFNTTNSTFKFGINGEYLVTGVISLAAPGSPEPYVSNVSLLEGANLVYRYDMSLQGRNPTFAFSFPITSNTLRSYSLTVASTRASNVVAGSYFTFEQVGVLSDTPPSIILPYQGGLFQASSGTLTTPLNLSTNFVSNTNSTIISVNGTGALQFSQVMTYMLTGVFYTSSPVTSVSIAGQTFPLGIGFSSTPPYTISVPFRITDTSQAYPVTVTTQSGSGTVNTGGTYLAVSCIASSNLTSQIGTIYNYYDSVGTIAVTRADLKIGGQTIQSLTGEYIELWNELNIPYQNQPGLQLLTGKYDIKTSVGPPGRTYYVNLPFYFYGNPELSLPIVALDRQDVEIWVSFNNFSNLTSYSLTSPTLQATIITEYVYLSNPEIQWFQNHRLDYVITQCQYDQFLLSQGFTNGIFKLEFKNPIKELFFVIQPGGNLPYDYSGNGLASLGLTYNGEDAFLASSINTLYLGSIEPFNHHDNFGSIPSYSTVPGRQFFMYSFASSPSTVVSSGTVNFSRIRQVLLEVNAFNSSGYYPSKNLRVTAVNQNILRFENGLAGIMFS